VATVLYTAQRDLQVWSAVASWIAKAGTSLPLDPASPFTVQLLAAGGIVPAAPGSADTASPAAIVRGTPGLHRAVSN
jgi:hypothetical protein